MRLNKLSHKSINSWLLLAALFAPIVYLFGSLFTTQLGAHGHNVLANDYSDSIVLTRTDFSFGYQVDPSTNDIDTLVVSDQFATSSIFVVEPSTSYHCVFIGTYNTASQFRVYLWDSSYSYIGYYTAYGQNFTGFDFSMPATSFYARFSFYSILSTSGAYSELTSVSINGPIRSVVGTSDYLFGQFFARDNFLAQSGRNVISGTQNYGFQPMGELIRYTDANMLHLANLEYGYLVIGYCYYAIHVVIVDLILYLTLFIPRLLRNIVERLEGKGNV